MTFYWRQESYDRYVLTGPGQYEVFKTYKDLYGYCQRHGIDARQA